MLDSGSRDAEKFGVGGVRETADVAEMFEEPMGQVRSTPADPCQHPRQELPIRDVPCCTKFPRTGFTALPKRCRDRAQGLHRDTLWNP